MGSVAHDPRRNSDNLRGSRRTNRAAHCVQSCRHRGWTQSHCRVDSLSSRDPQGWRIWKLPLRRTTQESIAGERIFLLSGRVDCIYPRPNPSPLWRGEFLEMNENKTLDCITSTIYRMGFNLSGDSIRGGDHSAIHARGATLPAFRCDFVRLAAYGW